MDSHLKQVSRQQKDSWNAFSSGWRKWDGLTMDFLQPVGDEMIRLAAPKADDEILDVAAGTGEPGLTMASLASEGRVVITDLAEDMLAIARESAKARGIANIETRVCDVSALPFPDETFDMVSCRFGLMFFPDMLLATQEMARVLKPGGRLVASVWGAPEKNPWITTIMGVIKNNIDISTPSPDAPGMFRCAEQGVVSGLFSSVGIRNITEQEVSSKLDCQTADTYWNMMNEVAAPVVAALNSADKDTRDVVKTQVYEKVNHAYPEGDVVLDASALVVYGEK